METTAAEVQSAEEKTSTTRVPRRYIYRRTRSSSDDFEDTKFTPPKRTVESAADFERRIQTFVQQENTVKLVEAMSAESMKELQRRQNERQARKAAANEPVEQLPDIFESTHFAFEHHDQLSDGVRQTWTTSCKKDSTLLYPHHWLRLASTFSVQSKTARQPTLLPLKHKKHENYLKIRDQQNRVYAVEAVAEGVKCYQQGQTADALDFYKRALDMDPKYAEGWFRAGESLLAEMKRRDAVEQLERALRIDPEHMGAKELLCAIQNEEDSKTKSTPDILDSMSHSESETGHLGADGKEVVLVLQDDDEVGAIHHDIDEEEAILGRVGEIKADHPEENVTGREVSLRVVVVSVSMLATIDVADIQERMKMTEEDEGEEIAHENILEIATGRNDGPYRIEAEVQAHDDIEMKNAVRYPDENTEETTEVRVHVAVITNRRNSEREQGERDEDIRNQNASLKDEHAERNHGSGGGSHEIREESGYATRNYLEQEKNQQRKLNEQTCRNEQRVYSELDSFHLLISAYAEKIVKEQSLSTVSITNYLILLFSLSICGSRICVPEIPSILARSASRRRSVPTRSGDIEVNATVMDQAKNAGRMCAATQERQQQIKNIFHRVPV
ncbi:hypothetical protein VTP01DRAFT_6469 [Rhizomucor pusillus]|uniref:uncharacterized protein n=1 Tax=Rhizomucor pusillus TaxID=4840 RepID=UPI0037426B2F